MPWLKKILAFFKGEIRHGHQHNDWKNSLTNAKRIERKGNLENTFHAYKKVIELMDKESEEVQNGKYLKTKRSEIKFLLADLENQIRTNDSKVVPFNPIKKGA
jgi:hypothetical protein